MIKIDNIMLSNGKTRCFDRNGIYEVDTPPEAVRPPMKDYLFKHEGPPDDRRRVGTMGATQGYKERIPLWHELVKEDSE